MAEIFQPAEVQSLGEKTVASAFTAEPFTMGDVQTLKSSEALSGGPALSAFPTGSVEADGSLSFAPPADSPLQMASLSPPDAKLNLNGDSGRTMRLGPLEDPGEVRNRQLDNQFEAALLDGFKGEGDGVELGSLAQKYFNGDGKRGLDVLEATMNMQAKRMFGFSGMPGDAVKFAPFARDGRDDVYVANFRNLKDGSTRSVNFRVFNPPPRALV